MVGRRFIARPRLLVGLVGWGAVSTATAVALSAMQGAVAAVPITIGAACSVVWMFFGGLAFLNTTAHVDERGFRRGFGRRRVSADWSDVEGLRGDVHQNGIVACLADATELIVVVVPPPFLLTYFASPRAQGRHDTFMEAALSRLRDAVPLHDASGWNGQGDQHRQVDPGIDRRPTAPPQDRAIDFGAKLPPLTRAGLVLVAIWGVTLNRLGMSLTLGALVGLILVVPVSTAWWVYSRRRQDASERDQQHR